MYLERSVSVEEAVHPSLYPDLLHSGLEDAEEILNNNKENKCKSSNIPLYPDLKEWCKENNISEKSESPHHSNNSLENYAAKVTNKICDKDQLDGEPKPVRAMTKQKKCSNLKRVDLPKKERNPRKRKHKHLKRGYKVLAFTVGLPITIPYLLIRTKPNKEDDDIESEFTQLASSTAKIFHHKEKKENNKAKS